MADILKIGGSTGTQVGLDYTTAPTGGYGEVGVVALDWGTPSDVLFLDPRPLSPGMIFRGRASKDRTLTLAMFGKDAGTLAKGQTTWEKLQDLLTGSSPVSLYYKRDHPTSGFIERELLAVPVDVPGPALVKGGGEPGVRVNGNLLMVTSWVAPFPLFRSVTEESVSFNCTGTTPNATVIARTGQRPCGVKVSVSTTGTLGSITISDGNRQMVLTATFGASAKSVDWYHADPTGTSIDSGVTLSIPAHLSLHSASTTITATPGGGSSGTHTITVYHYPLWETV